MNLTTIVLIYLRFFHPFYVSVSEIDFNGKNNSLEITHRIFADDLNSKLSEISNSEISFAKKTPSTDSLVDHYLQKHFSISVNDIQAKIKYVGYEVEEDAIWIYEEVDNLAPLKSVTVNDSILLDYTEQQSNLVHFKYDDEVRSYQLDVEKTSCKFSDFDSW